MGLFRKLSSGVLVLALVLVLPSCGNFFTNRDNNGNGGSGGGTGATPHFAYVAASGSASVFAFTVSAANGALTAISGSPYATGSALPNSIGADSGGNFVYVVNQVGGLTGYTINRNTGQLTGIAGTPIAAGTVPTSLAVDPQARFVFVVDSSSLMVFGITSGTGALTQIGNAVPVTNPVTVTEDPSGLFLFVAQGSSGISVFTIGTSGTVTLVNTFSASPCAGANFVAVDPHTKFAYATDGSNSVCAFTINGSTGALAFITGAQYAVGADPVAVTVDPTGKFLYTANFNANTLSEFTINTNGTLSANGSVNTDTQPGAVTVDPSGLFLYTANFNSNTVDIFAIGGGGALSSNGSVSISSNPVSIVVTK